MKLWIILFCIALVHCKPRSSNTTTDKNHQNSAASPNPPGVEERIIRHIEDEMLALNKSDDPTRDKRAIGIILRGILEALGYTVSPIQIASLANPTPAAQMTSPVAVAPASPPSRAAMMMMPSMPKPSVKPSPTTSSPAPPRQRETLRFTGILNFGNNLNTTNLISHLAQYEQLFHRNATTTAAPPAAPPPPSPPASSPTTPSIDHRKSRLQEPLFVQIPLPIAPNLAPPHLNADEPFTDISYEHEEYSHGHSEESRESKDGVGKKGNFEEEGDRSHHSEEYEHNYEYQENPDELRVDHGPKSRGDKSEVRVLKTEGPRQKHVEQKEYKKNRNVVNYSVENKKINDPSEVSEEGPARVGSKFSHSMYVNEPNWRQEHENKMYKLAAEQEAKAEALAEDNAERERNRGDDHELKKDDVEFHRSREREIEDRYEDHANKHPRGGSEEEQVYDGAEKGSAEGSIEDAAETHNDESVEQDHEEETKISPKTSETFDSGRTKLASEDEKESSDASNENSRSNSSESPPRESHPKSKDDRRERDDAGKRRRVIKRVKSKTPVVAYNAEESEQNVKLRDSYGEVLGKPGGYMDERIAGYIGMFKNPDTGIYEPGRIQELESLQRLYDHPNLINDIRKFQNRYEIPQNKYEEYELPTHGEGRNEYETSLGTQSLTAGQYETRRDEPRIVSPQQGLLQKGTSAEVIIPYTDAPSSADYGPYYSSYSHLYGPPNSDQGIIARLTSYNPTPNVEFADRIDDSEQQFIQNDPNKEQPSAIPTVVTLPQKITPADLILDREPKEVTAWPAPFDYVFDNSENKNVVVSGNSRLNPSFLRTNRHPSQPLSSEFTALPVYEGVRPLQRSDDENRVQIFFKNHQKTQTVPAVNEGDQVQSRPPYHDRTKTRDRIMRDKIDLLSDPKPASSINSQQRNRPSMNSETSSRPQLIQGLHSEPQALLKTRPFDLNIFTAPENYANGVRDPSYVQQIIPIMSTDDKITKSNAIGNKRIDNHAPTVRMGKEEK